jgi:4-hydroxythreonine-4-phosphate dehydrogenase
MKPILVTSGEPAGIGPDICVLCESIFSKIVVIGDKEVLAERAKLLKKNIKFIDYKPDYIPKKNELRIWHIPCKTKVIPGLLAAENASYVLEMLKIACTSTIDGHFSALVTGPVHKAHLQQLNNEFYGHTEFFQKICNSPNVVMMLADQYLRVALVTTHLPLSLVPRAISKDKIINVVQIVHHALVKYFNIANPRILIAGLNPHAGENGILGREEIDIISPSITNLQAQGINALGPYPADTMFLEKNVDAFIAMYHDQGLAVLKYASFGAAANISLGLPIIRTSVDHGTALNLAGVGSVQPDSLLTAIHVAEQMVLKKDIK